ncbi:MAG: lysophospholipid acyltransferase family protein [Dongiaceae bacterium]
MILWLRSLLFNILFVVSLFLIGVLGLPLAFISFGLAWKVGRAWAKTVTWLFRYVVGLEYEVRGPENIPKGSYIIASQHQSTWETVFFLYFFNRPAFILKKELMWLPVFGWYLALLRHVPIDRAGGLKALRKVVESAEKVLNQGRPVIIFPEGTRVRPGESQSYQAGIGVLYDRLQAPVLPVALNSGLFWPKRSFLKYPGKVIVHCLPPIMPGLNKNDFMKKLEQDLTLAGSKLLLTSSAA